MFPSSVAKAIPRNGDVGTGNENDKRAAFDRPSSGKTIFLSLENQDLFKYYSPQFGQPVGASVGHSDGVSQVGS